MTRSSACGALASDERCCQHPDDPSVWVEADYPHNDPATARRIVEAVELFVLLERADQTAWLDESRRLATDWHASWWAKYVFDTWPVPRLCGWKLVVRQLANVPQACAHLAQDAHDDGALSAAYLETRRVLEDLIEPRRSQSMSLLLDVCVPTREWQWMWKALPPIIGLADIQQAASGASIIDKLCSRLEIVSLPPAAMAPAEGSALDQLVQLCRVGVAINYFPDLKITVTRRNAVAFVTTVQTLLGSRSSRIQGRTRRLTVMSSSYPLGSIESAVIDATMLDCVQASILDGADEASEVQMRKLYWIAYALLSSDTSVRNVRVNGQDLSIEKVNAIEQMLHADEPLAFLFEDLATSIRDHQRTRLGASRFVLFDPAIAIENEETPVLDGTRFHGLRVLGSVDQWWIVLLPGWGKAWVRTQDAELSHVETSVNDDLAVTSLTIVPHRNVAATIALLRVVGDNVINLNLTQFSDVPEDCWFEVFNCCPQVQEVSIDGNRWSHLSNVIESVTSSRAKKLSRLFLRVQYITPQNVVEIREIFAALADRQHPFSKQLRAFGFWSADVPYGDATIVDADIYAHALRMLDENQTLDLFRLQLPVRVQTKEESTVLKEAFDRHQHYVLPVEANPLGIRAKAAFLSVMKAKNIPLAMQLDRGVITTIFHFAPMACVRCVDFEPPRVADRR